MADEMSAICFFYTLYRIADNGFKAYFDFDLLVRSHLIYFMHVALYAAIQQSFLG